MPSEHSGRFRHEVLAAVFQVRDGHLHSLLWRRGREPFEGAWALPGGPLSDVERLGSSLGRHLAAKVDLTDIAYLEQLETRSDVDRDPRERTIATAYLALVSSEHNPSLPDDTDGSRSTSCPPPRSTTRRSSIRVESACAPSSPTRTSATRSPRSSLASLNCARSMRPASATRCRPPICNECSRGATSSSPPTRSPPLRRRVGGRRLSTASPSAPCSSRIPSRCSVRPPARERKLLV